MSTPPSRGATSLLLPALIAVLIILSVAGLASAGALAALIFLGGMAAGILAAGAGLGFLLLRVLRVDESRALHRIIYAAALGNGTLSLLVLAFGSAGILSRPFWLTVLVILIAVFVVALVRMRGSISSADRGSAGGMRLWIVVPALFAGFSMLAATMPPGILWPAEGHGYDALEYHLGAPRDYHDAGRIAYLPHNIYSNFPFNVEMLYLLSMVVQGDAVEAGLTCQLLHAMFGLLALTAVWAAAAPLGFRGQWFAAVLMAATPFIVYLSGLAYVENAMLFQSAVALLAVTQALGNTASAGRWRLMAGLLSGFACGCKYTGLLFVAAPLFLSVLFSSPRIANTATNAALPVVFKRRLSQSLLFLLGIGVAMAPWLIKNHLATGNPVFPLAYAVFGANDGIWTDELADQWQRGHASPERSIAGRASRFVEQIVVNRLYGPVMALGFAGGATCIILRLLRRRSAGELLEDASIAQIETPCLWMMLIGSIGWISVTHLVDRFAVGLLIPAAILFSVAMIRLGLMRNVFTLGVVSCVLVAIAGFNLSTVWRLFTTGRAGGGGDRDLNYLAADLFGRVDLKTLAPPHIAVLNRELAAGRKILVIADARRFYLNAGADYHVVFNRNPFAEAAATRDAPGLLRWLREAGYDLVYVDWFEMRRLQRTYGFWPSINVKLFENLIQAGLRPVPNFMPIEQGSPYATLFEVPK